MQRSCAQQDWSCGCSSEAEARRKAEAAVGRRWAREGGAARCAAWCDVWCLLQCLLQLSWTKCRGVWARVERARSRGERELQIWRASKKVGSERCVGSRCMHVACSGTLGASLRLSSVQGHVDYPSSNGSGLTTSYSLEVAPRGPDWDARRFPFPSFYAGCAFSPGLPATSGRAREERWKATRCRETNRRRAKK